MTTLKINIYDFKKNINIIKFKYYDNLSVHGGDIFEEVKIKEKMFPIFQEDSIKTVKEKIYLATGILPCEQYIFNKNGSIGFKVKSIVGEINNSPFNAPEYDGELPIFREIYHMKHNLTIINEEHMMISEYMDKSYTLDVLSLKSLKIHEYTDIVYWSLIQFFPYFNTLAFRDYIDGIHSNYPLLFIDREHVYKNLKEEESILKNIYTMKYDEKIDINSKKSNLIFNINKLKVLLQIRGLPDLSNIFKLISTNEKIPIIIYNNYNVSFTKIYYRYENFINPNIFKEKKSCIYFIIDNIYFELDKTGTIYATINNTNIPINFEKAKKIIIDNSKILYEHLDQLEISFFKEKIIESFYKIIKINSTITYNINLDQLKFSNFVNTFVKTPFITHDEKYHWIKSIEYEAIDNFNGFDYYCNVYKRLPENTIEIINKYTDVCIILTQFKDKDFKNIIKYIQYMFSTIKNTNTKNVKNNLKLLRSIDPINYNIKKPFTRICQKPRQPVPIVETKNIDTDRLLHYWNTTKEEPLIYYCPNSKYPYPGFITNFHPDGNCLVCCFKKKSKKDLIYNECMNTHKYENQKKDSNFRYIINHGKFLEAGRIGNLPNIINKFLIYNLSDVNIISESVTLNVFQYAGKIYSISRLFKYTKDTKIQEIPIVIFEKFMNTPVWKRKRKGSELIKPIEVLENPKKNPIFAKHYKNILQANLDNPIYVYNDKGRYVVIDGFHRLAHCFLKKIKNIQVKFVSEKQLKRCFIRKYDIKNVSFITTAIEIEGGDNDKEPFYYIMGINYNFLKENCSFLLSICDVYFDTVELFIDDIINKLRKREFISNYLTNDLIKQISEFFIEHIITDTVNWNDLFYEILPILYNFIPIVINFKNNNIDIHMQHIYDEFDNIDNNFIVLLKNGEFYNPVYIIIPFIYSKEGTVEKKLYNYDDQFIRLIEKLLIKKKQEKLFTLQKIIELNYGKVNILSHDGIIYAVEINDNIYVSVEKTKINDMQYNKIIIKQYDITETKKFLEEYKKTYGDFIIDKIYVLNDTVKAYRIGEYVNFVNAKISDFPDVKIEYWNYEPEIILNAKTTKLDPILTHFLNHKFNDYAYFKEKFFQKYKNLTFPLKLEDYASEENQVMVKAIVEESQNPIKCELFKQGIYNFKKLYMNKHANENIYIKLK